MRFIPKKKETLTEADINPLDVNAVDLSYDEQYVQAIMKAVASESGAIVEYEQILAIEPHVTSENLVNIFHDTLEDIKNEEVKHISQLNTKLAEAPSLKAGYKDGEEEADSGVDKENDSEDKKEESMTESVKLEEEIIPGRYYSADKVIDAIDDRFSLTDEQHDDIYDMLIVYGDELSSEDMNKAIKEIAIKYEFTAEEIPELEELINSTVDPRDERKDEFKNDIQFDINTLEDIAESLTTYAAQQKVKAIIEELKQIEYDGDKEVAWDPRYYDLNKHKRGIIG